MIKKIIINKNKMCKKIKYKLLMMSVPAIMVLSSCSLVPDGNRARYDYNSNKSDYEIPNDQINNKPKEIISPRVTSTPKIKNEPKTNTESVTDNGLNETSKKDYPMTSITEGKKKDTKINFSNNNYNEFKNYLNDINTIYSYENIYNFNNTLGKYNNLNLKNYHNSYVNEITANEIYNIVLENNKNYKRTLKTSIYKEFEDVEIMELCEVITNTINDYLKDNTSISIERLKCVLSDLKIFKQMSSVNNAFITDDNCLIVSPNMLQIANMINGQSTEKDIIIHETIHLLQKGCNCDLSANSNLVHNFGISYNFNDVEVNSLDFSWLYESSAEKNMCNYTKHEPLVYKNMIGYLDSLSLVNVFHKNFNIEDTEKLSFKRTLDDLYNYFNVTTEKEKKEILDMMYSIEVMQTSPDDFYKAYEKQNWESKSPELIDKINYEVKAEACETLTKLFYNNLSKSIVNNNVTLEDVFYLISLYENDLNLHIKYDDCSKKEYNINFLKNYIDIQDNMFYELSKGLNTSQDEIENLFKNYTSKIKLNNGNIVDNFNLSFIDKNKIEYLKARQESLSSSAYLSIRDAYDVYSKSNKQKMY